VELKPTEGRVQLKSLKCTPPAEEAPATETAPTAEVVEVTADEVKEPGDDRPNPDDDEAAIAEAERQRGF
jgi:hypothetical protein